MRRNAYSTRMKTVFSIFFAFLFTLKAVAPGMDFSCELLKLPNLLAHYEEHKVCNNDSFWSFLINDYLSITGDYQDKHPDDQDHDDLPFHGQHQCHHISVFYEPRELILLGTTTHPLQPSFNIYQSPDSSGFIDSLFQPPRV